jgi:hypothetical protein
MHACPQIWPTSETLDVRQNHWHYTDQLVVISEQVNRNTWERTSSARADRKKQNKLVSDF